MEAVSREEEKRMGLEWKRGELCSQMRCTACLAALPPPADRWGSHAKEKGEKEGVKRGKRKQLLRQWSGIRHFSNFSFSLEPILT